MSYKNVLVLLMIVGIILISVDIARTDKKCPANKIIYRYIPRTYEEESESPAYVSDIFNQMFQQASPWINNVDSFMERKKEAVNKYFISQF